MFLFNTIYNNIGEIMSIDNKLEITKDIVNDTFDLEVVASILGPFKDIFSGKNIDFGSMIPSAKSLIEKYKEVSNKIFYNKLYSVLNYMSVNLEERVKLSEKILEKVGSDVKKQQQFLIWVNSITDLRKIKYYANAFRCYLICDITDELLFKIINLIERLTSFDLDYIASLGYDETKPLDVKMSYLIDDLIFIQGDGDYYHLTRLGVMLKQNCLNYDDGIGEGERIISVDDLKKAEKSEIDVIGYI